MTRRQAREQAFTLIFEKSFHPEITVEERPYFPRFSLSAAACFV